MTSINPGLFLVAMLANFGAIRLASLFLPDQFYFSFSSFLFDTRDLNKPLALGFKLAIPFLVAFGIVCLLLWVRNLQLKLSQSSTWVGGIIDDQAPITLSYAAAMVTLLMAWPFILLWDMLIDPMLQSHRLLFMIAYLAYVFSVGFFALAGANTALVAFSGERSKEPLTLTSIVNGRATKPFVEAIAGSFSAAIATFLASQAAS